MVGDAGGDRRLLGGCGPVGLDVWVMVRVGVLGVLVSRVVAAAAPASRAASRSRTVAAWVG